MTIIQIYWLQYFQNIHIYHQFILHNIVLYPILNFIAIRIQYVICD